MTARTSGGGMDGMSIEAKQVQVRIQIVNLSRELRYVQVGQPGIQKQRFGRLLFQLCECLRTALCLKNVPTQSAKTSAKPLPKNCICANENNGFLW
jgi:hypothetical protein